MLYKKKLSCSLLFCFLKKSKPFLMMLLETYIWVIPCQLIQSCASNMSKIHQISFAERSNRSDFKTLWIFEIGPVFPKLLLVNLQCTHLIFAYTFYEFSTKTEKHCIFFSCDYLSWNSARMYQRVCSVTINRWHWPMNLIFLCALMHDHILIAHSLNRSTSMEFVCSCYIL